MESFKNEMRKKIAEAYDTCLETNNPIDEGKVLGLDMTYETIFGYSYKKQLEIENPDDMSIKGLREEVRDLQMKLSEASRELEALNEEFQEDSEVLIRTISLLAEEYAPEGECVDNIVALKMAQAIKDIEKDLESEFDSLKKIFAISPIEALMKLNS